MTWPLTGADHELAETGQSVGGQASRASRRNWCPQLTGPGSADGDLGEPKPIRILPDSALRLPRLAVDPGHPLLSPLPGDLSDLLDAARGSGQPECDTVALTAAVVIRAGSIALDIGARRVRYAAVEPHAAVHPGHPSQDAPVRGAARWGSCSWGPPRTITGTLTRG